MFRFKKPVEATADHGANGAENGADNGAADVRADHEQEAKGPSAPVAESAAPAEPKPTPRRAQPPLRPLPAATPVELTRRAAEAAGPAARSEGQAPAVREKTLVVGRDVEFAGEIKSCQKLIVEGVVQVSSANCRQLHIGPTGVFRGRIEAAEVEVYGRFEGELVARERLIVRSTGRLGGNLRYGSITIDAGGEITGEIATLDKDQERADGNRPEKMTAAAAAEIVRPVAAS